MVFEPSPAPAFPTSLHLGKGGAPFHTGAASNTGLSLPAAPVGGLSSLNGQDVVISHPAPRSLLLSLNSHQIWQGGRLSLLGPAPTCRVEALPLKRWCHGGSWGTSCSCRGKPGDLGLLPLPTKCSAPKGVVTQRGVHPCPCLQHRS